MTRIFFLVSFLIIANSLWADDLMEFREQRFNAGFLYTNVDNNEYLGGKAHFLFGAQNSFLVGGSFLTFRENEDINSSRDYWQLNLGYVYRGDNMFPFGEQTMVRLVGFFNGESGSQTIKGLALDYHAPYQITSDIFLSPFIKGRLETDPSQSEGVWSWDAGLRLKLAIPNADHMYVGVQLDGMKNISSYDVYGIMTYQDIPVMGKIGGMFDYEWNKLLRYHIEASGALFFQTGKYFEAKGSVELLQSLKSGVYVSYRHNETVSNQSLPLFQKLWNFGVYVNF